MSYWSSQSSRANFPIMISITFNKVNYAKTVEPIKHWAVNVSML